jgi:flagellar protein FliS
MAANPYEKYRQVQVTSANPASLILMLYDGTIRHLQQAKTKIPELEGAETDKKMKLLEDVTNHLIIAQKAIGELKRSLRLDVWEGAENLYALYQYLFFRLVDANMQKDVKPVEEVIHIMSELREAWAQAAQNLRGKAPTSPAGAKSTIA